MIFVYLTLGLLALFAVLAVAIVVVYLAALYRHRKTAEFVDSLGSITDVPARKITAPATPETHYSPAATERALTGDIQGTLACGAFHWGLVTDDAALVTCEPCKAAITDVPGRESAGPCPRAAQTPAGDTFAEIADLIDGGAA